MCSEPNAGGDNIEAIMNPECKIRALRGGIQIRLFNRTTWQSLINRKEDTAPYFLYGNDGKTILGNILYPTSYQINANPTFNPTGGLFRTNFEMIDCAVYLPANECHICPVGTINGLKTCEGSQCVTTSPNGIRFVLLTYGQDIFDVGMNITSPKGSILQAYFETNRIGYSTNDTITGGYVEKNYMERTCRSTGVWIKNIVYPTYVAGKYTITFENVLKCTFMTAGPFGGSSISNYNRLELKVYKHEILVQTIKVGASEVRGKVYTFTL
jgi:hypothetical protein